MPKIISSNTAPAKPPGARQPVKTFRMGRISAAVWENESEKGPFMNVTFQRSYMDESKTFQHSDSFGRDDLPLVAKLSDQAHTFIFERQADARAADR